MQNSKKWLGLGAAALVLIALVVAATYNSGNFFSGSISSLSAGPDTVITTMDVAGQSKDLKINSLYMKKGVVTFSNNTLVYDEKSLASAGLSENIEFAVENTPAAVAPSVAPAAMAPATLNQLDHSNLDSIKLAPVTEMTGQSATVEAAPVTEMTGQSAAVEAAPVTVDYAVEAAPAAVGYTAAEPTVTNEAVTTSNTSRSVDTVTTRDSMTVTPPLYKMKPSSWIPAAHANVSNQIVVTKNNNTYNTNFSGYPNGTYHVKFMDGAVTEFEFDIIIGNNSCSDVDSFKMKDPTITYKEGDANKVILDAIIGVDNGVDLAPGTNFCKQSLLAMGLGGNGGLTYMIEEQANPNMKASTTVPPLGAILGGFAKPAVGPSIEFNFANLAVGGTIGTLQYGNNYYFNLSNGFNKILATPVSINLVPAVQAPSPKIVAIATNSGSDQTLVPGDVDKEMIKISVRNISGADQTMTKAVFSALVKADSNGDFEPNKDTSADVSASSMLKDYYLDFDQAKIKGYDNGNGIINFDGLNFVMPNGQTTTFKLFATKVNKKGENGRPSLQEDAKIKFFLKDFQLADPAVVKGNEAGENSGLLVNIFPKDCMKVTSFAFDADLTYNASAPVSPQNTTLAAFDGATKLSLADSDFCTADLVNLGLEEKTSGLYIELKDSANNVLLSDKMAIDNNPGPTIELMNKFLTISLVADANGKVGFRFANDFSKLNIGAAGAPAYGQKYVVTVRAIAGDQVTILPNNIAKYGIELIGQTVKLPKAPIQLPQQPAQQPQQPAQPAQPAQPQQPATVVTTTPATQPSTEPCKVGDKTFYLAGGPNSSYCKDLQSLVTTTGESTVFKVDQPAATPQVRYTTALAVQRILSDVIATKKLDARIRIKNLPSDWYQELVDARTIKSASSQEANDFKSVYASGILRGRVNPTDKSEVTLAPLERIKFIELLSLFKQGYSSVIGYSPALRDSELPAFALTYKNDPNKVWMYEAIAFGIEFDLIGKNDFDENSIQDYATRADMADYLANFKSTIESNPSLLER